jgi:hypothetical protein
MGRNSRLLAIGNRMITDDRHDCICSHGSCYGEKASCGENVLLFLFVSKPIDGMLFFPILQLHCARHWLQVAVMQVAGCCVEKAMGE